MNRLSVVQWLCSVAVLGDEPILYASAVDAEGAVTALRHAPDRRR